MRFAIVCCGAHQSMVLTSLLSGQGCQLEVFIDAAACKAAMSVSPFDFFVIDVSCRELGGEELVRHVREDAGWEPLIMCVAQCDDEETATDILRLGADSFMPMPIRYLEFEARVEALCRNLRRDKPTPLRFGEFLFDDKELRVVVDGNAIALTQREFDLVVLLLSNAGRLFSRDELMKCVWAQSNPGNSRTVDTHISRLRRKLGLDGDTGFVLTSVYGQGYRLEQVRGN